MVSLPTGTRRDDAVRTRLRAEITRLGSLRKVAKAIGCSAAWVSQVLNKGTAPGPKVLRYFGLQQVQHYEPLARRKKK